MVRPRIQNQGRGRPITATTPPVPAPAAMDEDEDWGDGPEEPDPNVQAPPPVTELKTVEELVTEVPKEVKTFIWSIKDFTQTLQHNSTDPISTEFNIGDKIGMSSTWAISLIPTGTGAHRLLVARTGGEPEAHYFICQASVKKRDDPAQNLVSVVMNQISMEVGFGYYGQLMGAVTTEDELVIHVEFGLFLPNRDAGTGIETLSGGAEALATDYGKLFKSEDNSDFVIKVKEGSNENGEYAEIKVHKAILGARNSVFQKMLGSEMTEVKTGTVVIEDLSPTCVRIMVEFIYTGKLNDDWKKVPDEMVRAANMYDLPLILNFLDRRLHVVFNFTNAMKLRRLARLHGLKIATKDINNFIVKNIDLIED